MTPWSKSSNELHTHTHTSTGELERDVCIQNVLNLHACFDNRREKNESV